MLSHKKYQAIVSGFSLHVQDEDTLQKLLTCVKEVTGYSEDKSNYSREAYEKVKSRRDEKGETSWTESRKKHYHEHKEELNKKRMVYYHRKKQQQKETGQMQNNECV